MHTKVQKQFKVNQTIMISYWSVSLMLYMLQLLVPPKNRAEIFFKLCKNLQENCAEIDENCAKVACIFYSCGIQIWPGL